jgi:CBS domain-containing protein
MHGTHVAVKKGTLCQDLIKEMSEHNASCAVIVDGQRRPIGIITEQDVTRKITFQATVATPVDQLMTAPVLSVGEAEYLYQAIGRMRKKNLRHMPVVDGAGRLSGVLDLHDAMAIASSGLMERIDRLTHEGSIEGLQKIKAAQVELVEGLFSDHLPIADIQAFLTSVNTGIYRRIVDLVLAEMEEDGLGAPPVSFCVIVMGSGGRGENYLFPDQDNGFILEDYADEDHAKIDVFFRDAADRMSRFLDLVGFSYCKGGCMATNPLWRKTLSQWIDQTALWGRKHNSIAVRLIDIFFDFQPVWGEENLAVTLRQKVLKMVSANHFFLQQMCEEEADHNVPLGFFGGFVTEGKTGHAGQTNLKLSGVLPLVEATRLLALREGIAETSTRARISALCEKGVLDGDEKESLIDALDHMSELLLKRQITDFKEGREVGYYLEPDKLPKHTRAHLLSALKNIDGLRQKVRSDFTGDIF